MNFSAASPLPSSYLYLALCQGHPGNLWWDNCAIGLTMLLTAPTFAFSTCLNSIEYLQCPLGDGQHTQSDGSVSYITHGLWWVSQLTGCLLTQVDFQSPQISNLSSFHLKTKQKKSKCCFLNMKNQRCLWSPFLWFVITLLFHRIVNWMEHSCSHPAFLLISSISSHFLCV